MIKNDAVERANGKSILDWLDTFERKSQTKKQTNKQTNKQTGRFCLLQLCVYKIEICCMISNSKTICECFNI